MASSLQYRSSRLETASKKLKTKTGGEEAKQYITKINFRIKNFFEFKIASNDLSTNN